MYVLVLCKELHNTSKLAFKYWCCTCNAMELAKHPLGKQKRRRSIVKLQNLYCLPPLSGISLPIFHQLTWLLTDSKNCLKVEETLKSSEKDGWVRTSSCWYCVSLWIVRRLLALAINPIFYRRTWQWPVFSVFRFTPWKTVLSINPTIYHFLILFQIIFTSVSSMYLLWYFFPVR